MNGMINKKLRKNKCLTVGNKETKHTLKCDPINTKEKDVHLQEL